MNTVGHLGMETSMHRFTDQQAVITGGASGIGAATATEFAREGAKVCIVDIDRDAGERQAEGLRAEGADALFLEGDVADPDSCTDVIDAVANRFGGIRYLVNSAVSFIAKGLDVTSADWQRSLGVNVTGGANMVQAAYPHLKRYPRDSAIVNLTSVSGYIAQPNRWTYNASKGAILTLTKCQAFDLARDGIRVNSISPGWTWTPEVDKAAGGDRERWEPIWGKFHLLRRCAEPREIARAVLFLCSQDASFITGTDLAVDGGYMAMGSEGLGEASTFAGSR
jgi:NAD(P)-dependent dehydrogenase (short-subunit alcohol dehydrogenase family)